MNDGSYEIGVSLSGGTGRASVASPAELTVSGGEMTAKIEWSSPYYDLMVVGGERYLPVNTDGNSVFLIPVDDLSVPLGFEAETLAMSDPHLIGYELRFDADSLRPLRPTNNALPWIIGAAFAVLCAAAAALTVLKLKRKRRGAKTAS